MNTKLKKHIQEVLKPKPMGVFTENDVISLEISDFIRNQHGTLINIRKLFLPTPNRRRRFQPVERQCEKCHKKHIVEYTSGDLFNFLLNSKKNPFLCKECKNIQDKQKKEKEKELLQTRYQNMLQLTQEYIDKYLSPDRSWKNNVKNKDKISALCQDVDYDVIANYIKNMEYTDFLNTPYWVAISEKVKIFNNWHCEMCGKNTQQLNVHHPNYELHGRELQNIRKLKCLCKDCHKKFHNLGE